MRDLHRWSVRVLVILLIVSLAGGCSLISPPQDPEDDNDTDQNGQEPPVQEEELTVVLYFGDPHAEGLTREERTVVLGAEQIETVVVQELIRGPQESGLLATIPTETRLLSIEVNEGIAYVDLSEEIQTQHAGGSTGEMFTIYSIVNSLTELPGIVQVQILIEGEKVESLTGHMEIFEPLERNSLIISH